MNSPSRRLAVSRPRPRGRLSGWYGRAGEGAACVGREAAPRVSIVNAEGTLNLERVRRAGTMAVVASFALIVLAACGEQAGQESEHEDITRVPTMSDAAAQATREAPPPGATPEAGEGTPVAGEATPAVGGESTAAPVEIVSHDIFYEPKDVTIPADTDVTIMLPNEGVTLHNFSITDHKNDDLSFDPIDIDIDPGATEQVTINAPAGEYYFFCNVPGHEPAGMWGTLTVK